MATKANKATMGQRVDELYLKVLNGWSRSQIQQYAAKMWQLTERPVDELLARARARIDEEAAAVRADAFNEHLLARRELRRQATERHKHAVALAILKDEAELLGLYPPKQMEHSGELTVKGYVNVSPDAWDAPTDT